jgi:LacI family transcriptional regulator
MEDVTQKGGRVRPKLADVARAAGVSSATVSRVLNNPDLVRPAVQTKVYRAIDSLGFTPDAAARALKSRRTRTVGAVVPTLGVAIFATGITGLQNRLRENGYTLLIANSEYDPTKELQETRVLLDRGVDGLVLVGDANLARASALAKQYGVPLVTTYVCTTRHKVPSVGMDNAESMKSMATYLLGLGHRQFGMITDAAVSNDRTEARRGGAMRALLQAGVDLEASRVMEVPYSVANGRAGLRTLLDAHPEITAVMCTSDALALGALAESRTLGLSVPRDLSITGYDDIEMSAHSDPPLTTVNVPALEIGRLAADRLVASMAGLATPPSSELPATLVLRESCATPRMRSAAALKRFSRS